MTTARDATPGPPGNDLWSGFFRTVPHGVVVFGVVRNDQGRLRDFEWLELNAAACDILHVAEADVAGRRLRSVYPDQLDPNLLRRMAAAVFSGSAVEFEHPLPPPGGRAGGRHEPRGATPGADGRATPPDAPEHDGGDDGWYSVTIVPAAADRLVVMFRSITDYKKVLRQAVELMNHDDLTGLANRRHLKSRFWVLRKRGVAMAIIYFDLNGFKLINDNHGHETGDRVLSVIGQRLKQKVRPGEMVARIGGDEFAVLLSDADLGTIDRVAERLIQSVEEPVHLADVTVQLSASVGAALYPDDAQSFEALLSLADERMYLHKRQRRSAVQGG